MACVMRSTYLSFRPIMFSSPVEKERAQVLFFFFFFACCGLCLLPRVFFFFFSRCVFDGWTESRRIWRVRSVGWAGPAGKQCVIAVHTKAWVVML